MASVPAALNEIQELSILSRENPAVNEWRDSGRKVIAFQCTYIPEEIIYAAGALPVRMVGDYRISRYDDAAAYMYQNTCSFILNCLEHFIGEGPGFLDGLAAASTCDCPRRLADVWEHYELTSFIHTIGVPRKISPEAYELYEGELRDFLEKLSAYLGTEVDDAALWEAIDVYNRKRDLLRELYSLSRTGQPPLAGSELMSILNASATIPPLRFIQLMEQLLQEIREEPRCAAGSFRVMVGGSPLTNPAFLQCIEEHGGLVIIDELCTGVRYWWEGVDREADPVRALARRYLHNFACPRMKPSDDRLKRIERLVRDYNVEAVIMQMVHYCVPQTLEAPLVSDLLEELGIPLLELDIEYGMGGTGQITTRIQAFSEMLQRRHAR